MNEKSDNGYDGISHGMCKECYDFIGQNGAKQTLSQFLERSTIPILVVCGDVRVRAANAASQELLGKEICDIEGRLGGDVIECVQARLPGGCGKTDHCLTCTIRNTVTDTAETGIAHDRVDVMADLVTPDGVKSMKIVISTERLGESVLLRIDDIHGVAIL